MTASVHQPVLPDEILKWLAPRPGGTLVDGTLGGGGHTRLLAAQVGKDGLVIGLDRDPAVVVRAETQLRGLPVAVAHANYADLPEVLAELKLEHVDGILLDLGLSSDQLLDANRGFSFSADGPLDLRFDPSSGQGASQLIARLGERQLADMIYRYGEERHSRRIARRIVKEREKQPIRTADQLARIIRASLPHFKTRPRIDPATRTFQALRIAVNEELKWLEVALERLPGCLSPGGRMAVISFHSLEDRLVKNAFRDDARLEAVTSKPLVASEREVAENPRARSAKLRVAERCATG
ncbi:MAG: 16S rRNA (cytosine(1402)-N(4))-methyltransferase [Planctomycetaceae bacterium TMED10]|nr:MAG: 16S rRNA (cytosine(1402)-N(4))-methyltransferase [Planctomycetaceae bacterium TMED10]